jgi:hypothetical protein
MLMTIALTDNLPMSITMAIDSQSVGTIVLALPNCPLLTCIGVQSTIIAVTIATVVVISVTRIISIIVLLLL